MAEEGRMGYWLKFTREACNWWGEIPVPPFRCVHISGTSTTYLNNDNAGGHGTKEVVNVYVKGLKGAFNIICFHQWPRSPATNMLDLGVWTALQDVVV